MTDALKTISTRRTPQTERATVAQVKNSAGGYVFEIGPDARIMRFLTMGTDGGTYYTDEKTLTRDNAQVVIEAATARGSWLVDRIVEISTAGRAPKQQPAIFALAIVSALGDEATRRKAFDALPAVCRTASTLYTFVGYMEQFRGWGPQARRGVGDWFSQRTEGEIAYQLAKYQRREGWTARDLLRLSHPVIPGGSPALEWALRGTLTDSTPGVIQALEEARTASPARIIELIGQHPLSWEMLPDSALTDPDVMAALVLKGMPQTALMRNLPRLTNLGILKGKVLTKVVDQLQDVERIRKGRLHPINILVALKTYAGGQSLAGSNTWTPDRKIIDALDGAFYGAFSAVEPTGKDTLIALDVSGSMSQAAMGQAGSDNYSFSTRAGQISCREVTAALALVMMSVEKNTDVVGFTTSLAPLSISPRQRLDDAVRSISGLSFGRTDCAQPMVWAKQQKLDYGSIIVLTDNETYAGGVHPHQALKEYRDFVGHDVSYCVTALTPTRFSIADPADPRSLDISGFDSNVPNLITDHARGEI